MYIKLFKIAIYSLLFFSVCIFSIKAEITLDGSFGNTDSIEGPEYLIKDEYGKIAGNNLFHSFKLFNINTNEKAIFTANSDISINNVISRVTGGQPSLIDGIIQSKISGANFFFLNPAGIMFGPNASIDVEGSFCFSTSDYIKMGESIFSASQPEISQISSVQPDAFGFLEDNVNGGININGSTIQVLEDKTLSIIGGDVKIENGVLYAPEGRINIASIASEGELEIHESNIETSQFDNMGDVSITSDQSFQYIQIDNRVIGNLDVTGNEPGEIFISAGNVELNNGSIVSDSYGENDGGLIKIDANSISIINKSGLYQQTVGTGEGGHIELLAREYIDINNSYIVSFCVLDSYGKGGEIAISTPSLTLGQESSISVITYGHGNAGKISIKTDSLSLNTSIIEADTESYGNAGEILIETTSAFINNGSLITSRTNGDGNAGRIEIKARESLTIMGNNIYGYPNIISCGNNTEQSGSNGNIFISTPNLYRDEYSIINAKAAIFDVPRLYDLSTVILDGTLGAKGALLLDPDYIPVYIVDDNLGTLINNSLFHSFEQLSLNQEELLVFTGPESINNIIVRVTGDMQSKLNGILFSDIQDASLFLMNPNGFFFGPGASTLNINGSFHVTTADYVKLGKSGFFYVNTLENSILSDFKPGIFGFSNDTIADISVIGSETENCYLWLPEEKKFSLIGGDIHIENNALIGSKNGTVNIISVSSKGEVNLIENANDISKFDKTGNINLSGNSWITTRGSGGGNIFIAGNNFEINNNSSIQAEVEGSTDGGVIDIRLKGDLTLNNDSSIAGGTGENAVGGASSINIEISNLNILNLSSIDVSSYGHGHGGNITINARDSIMLSGGLYELDPFFLFDILPSGIPIPGISSRVHGDGDGGNISIETNKLIIDDYQQISTATLFGNGTVGNIEISADQEIYILNSGGITTGTSSQNNAGSIFIESPRLIINNNGWIYSLSNGSGNAGNISIDVDIFELTNNSTINASGSVTLFGIDSDSNGGNIDINAKNSFFISSSLVVSNTLGEGNAGNINVNTPLLKITEFGGISTDSDIEHGKAGDININVDKLELVGKGSLITSSTKGGSSDQKTSGDISIIAKNSIVFNGPHVISAHTKGDSEGGVIDIKTPYLKMNGGDIDSSSTNNGKAGDIIINVEQADLMGDMNNDDINIGIISTSTKGGEIGNNTGGIITICANERLNIKEDLIIKSTSEGNGNAGKIYIETPELSVAKGIITTGTDKAGNGGLVHLEVSSLVLTENARLKSNTKGSGTAGSFIINANNITLNNSSITAFTNSFGKGGTIDIDALNIIQLDNESVISVSTFFENENAGDAGLVSIKANKLKLAENSYISSDTDYFGSGGNIDIISNYIELFDGSFIDAETSGASKAGNIHIESDNILITGKDEEGYPSRISTSTNENGSAGSIEIFTNTIELIDGYISSSTLGIGNAGTIRINAYDTINIICRDKSNPLSGSISVSSYGFGNSGAFDISALKLNIIGGDILASTLDGDGQLNKISAKEISIKKSGEIDTSTGGIGIGGDLLINSEKLIISDGSGINSNTYGNADGGNIRIDSKNSINIDSKGFEYFSIISSNTYGKGKGGNIALSTENFNLTEGYISSESEDTGLAGSINLDVGKKFNAFDSYVSTATEMSDGGDIQIIANDLLFLNNSEISTSVFDDVGDGGNISIDHPIFIVMDNSNIIANAYEGDGGNISIEADYIFQWPNNMISASSEKGVGGEVSIKLLDQDISKGLTPLPDNFFDASKHIKSSCSLKINEDINSFTIKPREALPLTPEDFLVAPLLIDDSVDRLHYDKGNFYEAIQIWNDKLIQNTITIKELTYLADAYNTIGYPNKALSVLKTRIKGVDMKQKPLLYSCMFSIGNCWNDVKKYLITGIDLAENMEDSFAKASLFHNIGNIYVYSGEIKKAIETYDEAISIIGQCAQSISERILLSRTLINRSKAILSMQNIKPSDLTYCSIHLETAQSIIIGNENIPSLPDNYHNAYDLLSLSILKEKLNSLNSREKIDKDHILMTKIINIAKKIENYRVLSYAFGYLGNYKENIKEYDNAIENTNKAIFWAQKGYNPEMEYKWYWQLGRLFKKINIDQSKKSYKKAINISGNSLQYEIIHTKRNNNIFVNELKPLYIEYVEILLKTKNLSDDIVAEAYNVMENTKDFEIKNFFKDECATNKDLRRIHYNIKESPENTAFISPLQLSDKTVLILTLPNGIKKIDVNIDSQSLKKSVDNLRFTIINSKSIKDVLKEATSLYEYLIKPVEEEFQNANIDTLIFSPEGIFRLLPFSVLFDGREFLIQKYSLGIVPAFTLTEKIDQSKISYDSVLITGLTKKVMIDNFPYKKLPNVENELSSIRNLFEKNKVLKNENFTLAGLSKEYKENNYSIIHFATHGYIGNTPQEIYLVAHNEGINLQNIEKIIGFRKYSDKNLELLTLSACNTAYGDETLLLGLSGIGFKSGARSVIGTLWNVEDKATSIIINNFYENLLKNKQTKSTALRKSICSFIQEKDSHPYYWAPFVLVGNWL